LLKVKGLESMPVAQRIAQIMTTQRMTLVTAESCTGGLIAHMITNVPGSSVFYLGGFVTYADRAKEALLGVQQNTLLTHGAVSKETAGEMARGARLKLDSDLAVAVTGIAGPNGGTLEKPVGLVYIALSASDTELCQRHIWQGNRVENKAQSADACLEMILAYLHERRLV
jgi:PncC family amidohydrolase